MAAQKRCNTAISPVDFGEACSVFASLRLKKAERRREFVSPGVAMAGAEVFDLGWLSRATVVRVELDVMANVRLMTESNIEAYKKRIAYRMVGGVATQRPFDITVPLDGHWYVAVDTEGLKASRFRAEITIVT
ncbi:DUF1883 domain-containing protein [Amycolatopsis kentuckyensis]|uniref:DUF1883 domain-containing protein n=1 Tax=Amycolatopsis kentuckyensis TaxID=218823 RepID=UPI003566FEF3